MARWLKQSTAFTFRIGPFVDSTDGVTAETALSIAQADIQISKNGGAFAQTSASPTTTHDADGWYQCPLTSTDTNTLGPLTVQIVMAGALPVWEHFMVLPANVYDSLVGGSDYLQVDTVQIEGSDATTQISSSSGAIDSRVANGTAQAATASTLQLASASTFADDELIGAVAVITGGTTGVGQSRVITDYVSSTDTATVSPDWTTTPTGTITYAIYPAPPAPTVSTALPTVLISSGTGTGQLSVTSGVVAASVSSMGAGTITAAAIATGAIDADALAADAGTEIAAAVWANTTGATVASGVITGAAATGTLSTTQATTNLTGYADDQLIGRVIIWTSGACEGEATDITDYANASGLLTFTALTTAPGNGDTFKIV